MADRPVTIVASDNEQVYFKAPRVHACEACSLNQGCGHYLLQAIVGRENHPLALPKNILHSSVDKDSVDDQSLILQLPNATIVSLSLLLYGLPLGFVLLIAWVVSSLVTPLAEIWVILASLLALFAGMSATGWLAGKQERRLLKQISVAQTTE